jgi:hypothetical protein
LLLQYALTKEVHNVSWCRCVIVIGKKILAKTVARILASQ